MGITDALTSVPRFGRFLTVGAGGAVIDLTVSSTLTITGVVSPEWAKLGGAECAIVLMFLVNDWWTFADHGGSGRRSKLRRLAKSNLVRSAGLLVQFAVVRGLTRWDVSVMVGGRDIWTFLTLAIAIGCAVLLNYFAESLFTWRAHTGK
ncbi:MAG: putative membrane protein [uncultured archaeon A07HR60]|nr:MAG: putative membrane protein [Halorubrum sp. J07HR59]ESS11509.1 MAG: putative membrane protein [uncultured archaeon A07HR60]